MTLIFNDTFTDTVGTALTAHTPNLGTSWTKLSGTAVFGISDANRCRVLTAAGSYDNAEYRADATFPADYEVRALVRFLSAEDGFIALIGRGGYRLELFQSTGLLRLNGGIGTPSASLTPPSVGVDYLLSLRMVGTTIKAYFDAVEQISVTDTTYATGSAGLFLQNQSASPSNSNGVHVDTFSVDDLAAASVAFRLYYITG